MKDGKNFKYRKSKPKGKAIDPDHHRNRTGKMTYTNVGRLPDPRDGEPTSVRWGLLTEPTAEKPKNVPSEKPGLASPPLEGSTCGGCGGLTASSDNYCRICGHQLRRKGDITSSAANLPNERVTSIFSSVDLLRLEGFVGFLPIWMILKDYRRVPDVPGVYIILYTGSGKPELVSRGSGGRFKDRDPNVNVAELDARWVVDSIVLYIGQAGGRVGPLQSTNTLRSRVNQYLMFGQGRRVAHWGGRYIWQIRSSTDLVVCWKPLPRGTEDPRVLESELLRSFYKIYKKPPFANIVVE